LLDRDGVINEAVRDGYVTSPDMVRLLPGAADAIAGLNEAGYGVIVISNQRCVGKGLITQTVLNTITTRLQNLIYEHSGGVVERFYYCTHLLSDNCPCRKPKPGLIMAAQKDYGFDPAQTYLVGDSLTDMQAARAAGCPNIFVRTGIDAHILENNQAPACKPDHVARDLADAVDFVLTKAG